MVLLDLWAHEADVLHYYIDRAAGESFLSTATQRESVLATANLLDYTPRTRTSATATVLLQNTGAAYVNIPASTAFTARSDSKSFQAYSTSGACIPPLTSVSIPLAEGTQYTEEILTTSSNGTTGQRYTLSRSGVVTSSVIVYVYENGVTPTTYHFVSRITAATTGERAYATYVTADGTLQVIFGSALNGFSPPVGSKVTCTYVVSSGATGNLPGNSIVGFSTSAPTGISITSSTSFTGGVDDESIDSMKLSIPVAVSAQNRAVTSTDFVALALQVPGVAKAAISFVPGLAQSASGGSVGTNASVTILPQIARSDYLTTTDTSQVVSSALQAQVVGTIQPLALLGVTVLSATTISWQGIDIQANVFVTDRFVQSWVQAAVITALNQLFDFDSVFFGQRLHIGQVYQLILSVPGVDYCQVTRFDLAGATGVQSSILINSLKLPKKGTFTLTMSGGTTTSG